VRYKER